MEIAATFYYVTISLVAWIVGALLVIVLISLIKTLRIIQNTVQQVKTSVTNFDMVKQAISSGITAVIENFLGKKLSKGGGKHG